MPAPARSNETYLSLKEEFARYGIKEFSPSYTGKGHYKVSWRHNERCGDIYFAGTTGDSNERWIVKGKARRQFREAGIEPVKTQKTNSAPRLVSSNDPLTLLKNNIAQLTDDHEALTDLILDALPTVEKLAKAAIPADQNEARFIIQTQVNGRVMGLVMALLAGEDASAIETFRYKLIPALRVVEEPAEEPKVIAPPVQEETPAAPVKATRAKQSETKARKDAILIDIYQNAAQTHAELLEKKHTGYKGEPKYLYQLLWAMHSKDKSLTLRDGRYWLTREGAIYTRDLLKAHPQKQALLKGPDMDRSEAADCQQEVA